MCIMVCVDGERVQAGRSCRIKIPLLVETLQFLSAERKLVEHFDLVLRNVADDPAYLFLVHKENVSGSLATDDWFSDSSGEDGTRLIQRIFGKTLSVANGALLYTGRTEGVWRRGCVEAEPLTSRMNTPTGVFHQVDSRCIMPGAHTANGPVLRKWICGSSRDLREEAITRNSAARPFSAFRLGPIPGRSTVFARVSCVIDDEDNGAYGRLVQPGEDCAFSVISSQQVYAQTKTSLLDRVVADEHSGPYRAFFEEHIQHSLVEPEDYHVIILQPNRFDRNNDIVRFRPTSCNIAELFIADPEARDRALWFKAWSQDFSIILAFGPAPSSRRALFGARLTASKAVAI